MARVWKNKKCKDFDRVGGAKIGCNCLSWKPTKGEHIYSDDDFHGGTEETRRRKYHGVLSSEGYAGVLHRLSEVFGQPK